MLVNYYLYSKQKTDPLKMSNYDSFLRETFIEHYEEINNFDEKRIEKMKSLLEKSEEMNNLLEKIAARIVEE